MLKIDLAGQKFGRLTAISDVAAGGRVAWMCRCECGGEVVVSRNNLRSGAARSCGCLRREVQSQTATRRNLVHGHNRVGAQTRTHRSWTAMLSRCRDVNLTSYPSYGGRGIVVCERWLKYQNFLEDMGERPDGTTLDRIDNDGNYEPGNCRWATGSEQQRNKRDKKRPHSLQAFRSSFPGVGYSDVHLRKLLRSGCSFQDIGIRWLGWTGGGQ